MAPVVVPGSEPSMPNLKPRSAASQGPTGSTHRRQVSKGRWPWIKIKPNELRLRDFWGYHMISQIVHLLQALSWVYVKHMCRPRPQRHEGCHYVALLQEFCFTSMPKLCNISQQTTPIAKGMRNYEKLFFPARCKGGQAT